MPPAPDFDLYEALELKKTALLRDIRDAYRRLALIHHPDKNPGDQEATARFQRIVLAHETLSDPMLRAGYDNRETPSQGSSTSSGGFYYYDEEDGMDNGFEDDFRNSFRAGSAFFAFQDFLRQTFPRAAQYEEFRRRAATSRAADEKEQKYQEQLRAEKQRREAMAEAERLARAYAKKAAEEDKLKSKENKEKQERIIQEMRWSRLNAVTDADKQRTCLHSDFWPKERQKRKFKCGTCGKKTGMIAYKCPHCSLRSCQPCLSNMSAKRPSESVV